MAERYFYTDPLAAAWMAKHFGMRLRPDCYSERALPDGEDITRFAHHAFGGRFYVHPDSLHLLEPREADLYATDIGCGWLATTPSESWKRQVGHFRIVQRKGMAFFWPESVPL